MASPRWDAGRHQVAGRDHAGDLGAEGGPVDVVGPAHVSGLHGQMELVADVGPGVAIARGRAVAGPGVGIGGVALATVGTDAEHLGRLHLAVLASGERRGLRPPAGSRPPHRRARR